MPPFNHFTTKAKEAIRRAHELAIERGQNHVNPVHLLAALILQEESMVNSILDKLEVDTVLATEIDIVTAANALTGLKKKIPETTNSDKAATENDPDIFFIK